MYKNVLVTYTVMCKNETESCPSSEGIGPGNQVAGENSATQNLGSGNSEGSWEVHFHGQRVLWKP